MLLSEIQRLYELILGIQNGEARGVRPLQTFIANLENGNEGIIRQRTALKELANCFPPAKKPLT